MRCLRPGIVGYRVHPAEGLYLECDGIVDKNPFGKPCGFTKYMGFSPGVLDVIAAEREHHQERTW